MVTYVNRPTPQDFIYTLLKNWASLVSGALSVPFTMLSIYSTNPNAKVIFGLLAVCGVFVASYQLWAREREERVKTQDELERQIVKFGRPDVTLGLKNDEAGQLWVCMMNYSNRPAVNVRADNIQCGDRTLRFINPPSQLTAGFSPNVQVCWVGHTEDLDIATTYILNANKGPNKFEPLLIAIRYTDLDAQHEWVTFGRFTYSVATKRFELEKQWVEQTDLKARAVLTV